VKNSPKKSPSKEVTKKNDIKTPAKDSKENNRKLKESPSSKKREKVDDIVESEEENEPKKSKKKLTPKSKPGVSLEKDEIKTNEENIQKSRPKLPISKFIIFSSSVSNDVINSAKLLGGVKVESSISDKVTHLVVSGEGRTMKVLETLSRGKFIVNENWVLESVENDSWLPEDSYEVNDWFPGAKGSRLAHNKDGHLLFTDKVFYVSPHLIVGDEINSQALKNMITRNGGKVQNVEDSDVNYAIVGNRTVPNSESVENVTVEWLWDALSNYKIPKDSKFTPQPRISKSPKLTEKRESSKKIKPKKKEIESKNLILADDSSETNDDHIVKNIPNNKRGRSDELQSDDEKPTKKKKIESQDMLVIDDTQ